MKVTGFTEAVASAVIIEPRFHPDGFLFLRDSLESTISMRSKRKKQEASPTSHVTATDLLEGFRRQALKEFGPMAPTVLNHWGIRNCRDIGEMVFLLVEVGAFGRTEEDSLDAFDQGFDFHDAFVTPFQPPAVSSHS